MIRYSIMAVLGISLAVQCFAEPNEAKPMLPGDEPMPCTISFVAIGNATPVRYVSPKKYLDLYGGRSEVMDASCKELIAGGLNHPVLVPVQENEKPPSALKVYLDQRTKVYQSFSLILGGVSTRLTYPRGKDLQIYQQHLEAPEEGASTVVKDQSIKKLPIPEDASHMAVIFLNRPKVFTWENYEVKTLDISPEKVPSGSIIVVNASSKDISLLPAEGGQPLKLKRQAVGTIKPTEKMKLQGSRRYRYALAATPEKIISTVIAPSRADYITLIYFLDELQPATEAGISGHSIRIKNTPLTVPEILNMRKMGRKESNSTQ